PHDPYGDGPGAAPSEPAGRGEGWEGVSGQDSFGGRASGPGPRGQGRHDPYGEGAGAASPGVPDRAGGPEFASGQVPFGDRAGGPGPRAEGPHGPHDPYGDAAGPGQDGAYRDGAWGGPTGRSSVPSSGGRYADDTGGAVLRGASGSPAAPAVHGPQGQASSRAEARTASAFPPPPDGAPEPVTQPAAAPERSPAWQTPRGEVPVVPPEWRAPDRPPRRLPRLGRRPRGDLQTLLGGLEAQPRNPSAPASAADEALVDALREHLPYEATTRLLAEIARRWPSWPHKMRRELCLAVLDLGLLVTDDRPGCPGDDLRAANAASLYRWAVRPLGGEPQVADGLAELLPRLSRSDGAGRAAFWQIVEGTRDDDALLDAAVWRTLVTTAHGRPPRPAASPAARSSGWGGGGTRTVRPASGRAGSQDGRWIVTTMVCVLAACVGLIVLLAQLA
ncbi:hypothetical protein QCN29_20460, partial [Streptomyces sp. HNM0663]|nr:hypothetical protein [Streptomyces chengmaiensis]